MRGFRRTLCLLAAALLIPCAAWASDLTAPAAQDELFRQLKEAARKKDAAKAEKLAASLADYPVPSYVEYYRLRADLANADESEVDAFLEKYPRTAIGDRLRNDWLRLQGDTGNWTSFDKYYPDYVVKDDMQVECYALLSSSEKGHDVADEARNLLKEPKKYGEACYALIEDLAEKSQFTDLDIWFQSRLAAENALPGLAARIASIAGADKAEVQKALDKPSVYLGAGPGVGAVSHETFILALGRQARKDREAAVSYLRGAEYALTAEERGRAWAVIALPESIFSGPNALEYWKKTEAAPPKLSAYAHEWKVRAALRREDWQKVLAWIGEMPFDLQQKEDWVYWKARALAVKGDKETARKLYLTIAGDTTFYGQLAREELGGRVVTRSKSRPVSAAELKEMENNPGFQLARKFFDMKWRFEAVREWNWQLRFMTDRQLIAAAEYAGKLNLLDRMVNTSDRTREEVDFAQRYPMPHRETVKAATDELGIDMAWTYGLVRQESRFVMNAQSAVGASGLMQLMPGTAKLVAKKIGLTGYRAGQINSVETNVLLGTNYLNMMLDSLSGSQVLASAGYNAGPGRPKTWIKTLKKPVEGAIFAETIPFTETRGYVKNVMANATCYAAILERKPQSLKRRLGVIEPPLTEEDPAPEAAGR